MNINEIRSLISERESELMSEYMINDYLEVNQEYYFSIDKKLAKLKSKFETIKNRTSIKER